MGSCIAGLAVVVVLTSDLAILLVVGIVQIGFLVCGGWKLLLLAASRGRPEPPTSRVAELPPYSVLVALHDEAEMIPDLIERLDRLDYPRDRLQAMLLLESHDQATQAAAACVPLPHWISVVVVPPGVPVTKPRALNHGLARVNGDFLTIYDAEDAPEPGQLLEAVARFRSDGVGDLGCVQAPLRIRRHKLGGRWGFIQRHFAIEYAALFEVILPGMARLGLPFPLGGTSNHFRVSALETVGGWDAWNVTEDADLGFRLWRHGWRLDVIRTPTLEPPPNSFEEWLPQRTRWLKGFMQTVGVHSRDLRLCPRGGLALFLTLGTSIAAASLHAFALAWIATSVLVATAASVAPATPSFALGVLTLGTLSAWLTCQVGSRRAGLSYDLADMLMAPVYWSLLTLAFWHALWRLITQPFVWNKTAHRPEGWPVHISQLNLEDAGRRAA